MKHARILDRGWRRWAGLAAACACLLASRAEALTIRHMDLDEVIRASETIFVATCESKRSVFRAGNILTIYTLRPSEFWKGSIATNADGAFEMEDLGGSIGTDVRLGQYVGGAAGMIPGEEVLLFTRAHKPTAAAIAGGAPQLFTPGNPEIIGRVQGRYSVLTDDSTGQKYLLQPGLEGRGIVPSDASMRKFLNVQQGAVNGKSAAGGVSKPSAAAIQALAKRQMEVHRRIQSANAPGQPKSGPDGKPRAIAEFEALSRVRSRVIERIQEHAREQK